MTPEYRPYQATLEADIYGAWNAGASNVLAVCPTGGGKTVVMAGIAAKHNGASIHIAHRQELVGQMSLALARCGLVHRVVGPTQLVRNIVAVHMMECGRSFYDPLARCGVAGVDTLVRRDPENWFQQITLWQQDEAHHVLRENKWGKAALLFPNARGIGWTATPGRADGYGLGRHADGLMDAMVSGPSMRELINTGYLTDYRVFCPPSDVDLSTVTISAGGDFSPEKLSKAVHESHIVGDIVKHYLRIAPGKLGVTFAVDIEHATEIAAAYRAAGVPSEVVTSKTPDTLRAAILRRFRAKQILQLVNVDLFGEGFDLPAIEVVSMGRPTASFTLYAQQFGRALRLLDGKQWGIIIDHVGNVLRHGLPDRPRKWSLNRRERKGSYDGAGAIPLTSCTRCLAAYERLLKACPYCGNVYEPGPGGRSTPEQVDGDLMELDPAVLAAMRGERDRIDGSPPNLAHLGPIANRGAANMHLARQQAQTPLRAAMGLWLGWQKLLHGGTDGELQRRFFYAFGTDVMTAQTLGRPDAEALTATIAGVLGAAGVVASA